MTDSPAPLDGLSQLADRYDGLLCDVWGVVHNGVAAHAEAVDALVRYRRGGGKVVFVTNAPRPFQPIMRMLDGMGVSREAYDGLVSSGDVTRELIAPYAGQSVYYMGPESDLPLFTGLRVMRGPVENAQAVVVSSMFGDDDTPDMYDKDMEFWLARGLPLICANPDKVVEQDGRLIYCAGALADAYAERGGRVVMAGKPHMPIYERAIRMLREAEARSVEKSRLLAIGDAVRTDAVGAAELGIDFLFVTGSIHAEELDAFNDPAPEAIAELLAPSGVRCIGYQPRLAW